MDNPLSFVILVGAFTILATVIFGLLEVRRARALDREIDAFLADSAPAAPERPTLPPTYLDQPGIARLDTAIARLRIAHDGSPSPALRDLATRKINEAHATLITRIAADQRANSVSTRARMARLGR